MSNPSGALPPISGVTDPQAQQFLMALQAAWDLRNGNSTDPSADKHRFITKEEFSSMANTAVADAMGGALAGAPIDGTALPTNGNAVTDAINNLSDFIKGSILYQLLGTNLIEIDVGYLNEKLDTLFKDAKTLIFQEQTTREDADSAMVKTVSGIAVQTEKNRAAILKEEEVRVTKDTALAQAINTMWAAVGSNVALIQDGELAEVTPSAVEATAWKQVQAAAIDPNTGQPTVAILRQDFDTQVSKIDGTLQSIYSVRAQLSQGGTSVTGTANGDLGNAKGSYTLHLTGPVAGMAIGMFVYGTGLDSITTISSFNGATVNLSLPLASKASGTYTFSTQRLLLGGFGLAATGGAGSTSGSSIDFGVRGDKFWIGGTTDTPSALTQIENGDTSIPFMVLTSRQPGYGGKWLEPGVYIKSANIALASITNAHIGGDIKSDNYYPGTQGWIIQRDGSAEFYGAKFRGVMQSNNYVEGTTGWKIGSEYFATKDEYNHVTYALAEFNGILLRRPQIVSANIYYPSSPNTFTYSSGSGSGKDGGGTPAGWGPPELIFYLDTLYEDYIDIWDSYRPGFIGKALCVAATFTYSGAGPGAARVYDIPVEATPMPSADQYVIGITAPAGGRVILKLVVPVPRNIHSSVTSITITGIKWSLMRVT